MAPYRKKVELDFEKNEPRISDHNYDKLKKEILDLEKKYNFLYSKYSPSNSVGFYPSKNFMSLYF